MRKPIAAFAFFAWILAAPHASAIPIIGDPGVAYFLRIVANLLRTIQQVQLEMQRGLQRRIDVLVSDVAFPSYRASRSSIPSTRSLATCVASAAS